MCLSGPTKGLFRLSIACSTLVKCTKYARGIPFLLKDLEKQKMLSKRKILISLEWNLVQNQEPLRYAVVLKAKIQIHRTGEEIRSTQSTTMPIQEQQQFPEAPQDQRDQNLHFGCRLWITFWRNPLCLYVREWLLWFLYDLTSLFCWFFPCPSFYIEFVLAFICIPKQISTCCKVSITLNIWLWILPVLLS